MNTMKFIPRQIQVRIENEALVDNHETQLTTPVHPALGFYKITEHAFDPQWGTDHAACFDLRACLLVDDTVNAYTTHNEKKRKVVRRKMDDERGYILIEPGERVMVPTGLIFEIPVGYSVRLHSRSGLALKQGLVLANHEGVIDSDYFDPTYVVLTNDSLEETHIFHGDRIGQGEMIVDIAYNLAETKTRPEQKTNRQGGFGSTGIQ